MTESGVANVNAERTSTLVGSLEPFHPSMSWNNYRERMDFYFEANGIKNEPQQKAIFLTCVGETTFEIIRSLLTPLGPKDVTFQEIIDKLDGHFHPKPNEIVQRFIFHSRCQKTGESMADFVKDLRKLSEHCNFAELNNMLRDRIVCGVADEVLQKRLFSESKLDFQRAYEIALAHEAAHKNVLDIRGSNDVMLLSKSRQRQGVKPDKSKPHNNKCFRCEGNHQADKCFFKDKECDFCHLRGHASKACYRKRAANRQKNHDGQINAVQRSTERRGSSSGSSCLEVNSMFDALSSRIVAGLSINGRAEEFEVDSGSSCTVMSEETWQRVRRANQKLTHSSVVLQTWSKEKLRVLGSTRVIVKYLNKEHNLPVIIVAGGGRSLLGRDWFHPLGISIQGVHALGTSADWADIQKEYAARLR